jgi:formylglycine-generating enzyme
VQLRYPALIIVMADLLPELAIIPAGEFVMGAEDAEEDQRPAHRVDLDEFEIGVCPVTHREYARFIRETGRRPPAIYELPLVVTAGAEDRERTFRAMSQPYVWLDGEPPEDRLDHPITLVGFEDATAYCEWLSATTGRVFRLPTEAQWEKAARGGVERKRYPWGDRLEPDRANYLRDPALRATSGTSRCRAHPPNYFGLFDTIGNVWEWVHDWYDPIYYARSPRQGPQGPDEGHLRLVRGGGWLVSDVLMLTCSHRHKVPPDTYSYAVGFRVVCLGQ